MTDLPRRLAVALVAVPAILGLVWLKAPWPLGLLVLAVSLAALAEMLAILRRLGHRPFTRVAFALAAAFHAAAILEAEGTWGSAILAPASLLALATIGPLLLMFSRGVSRKNPGDAAATLFAVAYAGFLPTFLTRLHHLDHGAKWVGLVLLLTWGYDTAAYLWGKSIGRAKLWPEVSPAKTWAGWWGGSITVTLVAVGLKLAPDRLGWPVLVPDAISPVMMAVLAPLAAAAAQAGDLAESLLKRAASIKDSGALLPGHGGLLDKLDALLFTAPLIWFVALSL